MGRATIWEASIETPGVINTYHDDVQLYVEFDKDPSSCGALYCIEFLQFL